MLNETLSGTGNLPHLLAGMDVEEAKRETGGKLVMEALFIKHAIGTLEAYIKSLSSWLKIFDGKIASVARWRLNHELAELTAKIAVSSGALEEHEFPELPMYFFRHYSPQKLEAMVSFMRHYYYQSHAYDHWSVAHQQLD